MHIIVRFQLYFRIPTHSKAEKMRIFDAENAVAKLGYRRREKLSHCGHSRCLEMLAGSGERFEHKWIGSRHRHARLREYI